MLSSTRRRRRGGDPRTIRSKKKPTTGNSSKSKSKTPAKVKSIAMAKVLGGGERGEPSMTWVMLCAALYVLSGVTQVSISLYFS